MTRLPAPNYLAAGLAQRAWDLGVDTKSQREPAEALWPGISRKIPNAPGKPGG